MRLPVLLLVFSLFSAQAGRAQNSLAQLQVPATGAHPAAAPAAPAEVLDYAEQMPTFTGGEAALHRYLASKIVYPLAAYGRGQSGTVVLQFIVDEAGRVLDPQVVKSAGADFDAEAVRLARLMPWWEPGRHQGRPARVRCTLPIVFTFRRSR